MVRLAEERKEAEESGRPGSDDVDFDSLRNLSDELGIDMSFLDSFGKCLFNFHLQVLSLEIGVFFSIDLVWQVPCFYHA